RSKVRVLKHADVGDEERPVVRGNGDAERIATDVRARHHRGKVVWLEDPALRVDARLNLGDVDHVHLERALIDDVEIAALAAERQVPGKGAFEALLRRRHDTERTIERMRGAVEIDRTDDLAGNRIADPDVPVFTTREIHAAAVGRERHAEKA